MSESMGVGGGANQRVDLLTVVALGLILMPLLTMWHEIGGHAALCVVQGGHVATLGAFYVDCDGLGRWGNVIVALAGVGVNTVLSAAAWIAWRRVQGDRARLVLWLIWVSEGFVAAGYLCFSGVSGVGDLGPGPDGGIGPLPAPWLWRAGELALGVGLYILLVRAAIRALTEMLGSGALTERARRRIAHGYYATCGIAAVVIGLLNPVGLFITIMSAAASSFGGLAGFISIGFATPAGTDARPFRIDRSVTLLIVGIVATLAFAVVLGPSRQF